jgi:hypothetical protein
MKFWIENHPVSTRFNKLLELRLLRYKIRLVEQNPAATAVRLAGCALKFRTLREQFRWIWQTRSTLNALLDNYAHAFK